MTRRISSVNFIINRRLIAHPFPKRITQFALWINVSRFSISQSQNAVQIKIVEISPKLNFIGANLEETIQLQREHEQIHRKIQVRILH